MKYFYLLLIMLLLIVPIGYSEKVISDQGTYTLVKEYQVAVDTQIQEEIDSMYQQQLAPDLDSPAGMSSDNMVFYTALFAFIFIIIIIVVFVLKNFGPSKSSMPKASKPRKPKKLSRRERKLIEKEQRRKIKEAQDMINKYGLASPEEKVDVLKKYNFYNFESKKESEKQPENASGQEIDVLKKYNLYTKKEEENVGQVDVLKKYNLYNKTDEHIDLTKYTQALQKESREMNRSIKEENEEFEHSKFSVRDLQIRKTIMNALEHEEDFETITNALIYKGYKKSEIRHQLKHVLKTLELKKRLDALSDDLDEMHFMP